MGSVTKKGDMRMIRLTDKQKLDALRSELPKDPTLSERQQDNLLKLILSGLFFMAGMLLLAVVWLFGGGTW